jgi:hypothetical protein
VADVCDSEFELVEISWNPLSIGCSRVEHSVERTLDRRPGMAYLAFVAECQPSNSRTPSDCRTPSIVVGHLVGIHHVELGAEKRVGASNVQEHCGWEAPRLVW